MLSALVKRLRRAGSIALLPCAILVSACSHVPTKPITLHVTPVKDVSIALPLSFFENGTILDPFSIAFPDGRGLTISVIGSHDIEYLKDIRAFPEYVLGLRNADITSYSSQQFDELNGVRKMTYRHVGEHTIPRVIDYPHGRAYVLNGNLASIAYLVYNASAEAIISIDSNGFSPESFQELIDGSMTK